MSDDFVQYERQVTTGELRPYVPGESLFNITVNEKDIQDYGCPKEGDMVARDPKDRDNQWLVSKEYFERHYKPEPIQHDYIGDRDVGFRPEPNNRISGGPARLGKEEQF